MECNTRTQTDPQFLDTVFALLRDRRRRYAVSHLAGCESSVSVTELATAVAAREFETEPEDVSAERVDAVEKALLHVHLPKLADAGVVAYDTETRSVSPQRLETLCRLSNVAADDTGQ